MAADTARADPDALLASLQREASRDRKGRLKIFFGMAPGVGKTYAMLNDARRKDAEGIDVVVGYIETHGRIETEALLKDLIVAPRRRVEHRGVSIEEMDLDAIIFLRPQWVLVDELAHANAPGSRHPKRYQDILELLDLGIDVSTTLNVQHVESRADTVRSITGVPVQETVPDSLLELAQEIELIDISPERLRERLAEGKVYLGAGAESAAQNFFKEDNLTALREIALRLTAERVDEQLRHIRQGRPARAFWNSSERLMVAIGASPLSTPLIRRARRMAYAVNAPWIAVSVESGERLTPEAQRQLDKNLSLARELGAEVIFTHDQNIAHALIRVAQQNNVSRIIAGKPLGNRLFEWLRGGSLVDQLIRLSGPIDIDVVTAETAASPKVPWPFHPLTSLREYLHGLGIVAAVTFASLFLVGLTGYWSIALFYLLTVTLQGTYLSRGPVLLAAATSALLWDYLFIPPLYTFYIGKFEDGLMFGIFFIVALVTGQLTSRIRAQERDERQREQRAQALYRLTRNIAIATTTDEVLLNAVTQIHEIFGVTTAFLMGQGQFGLAARAHPASTFHPDEKEIGVATWVYRNRRNAGRFTDTLPSAQAFHVPLFTSAQVMGVMAVRPQEKAPLTLPLRDLLEAFARQIALVLEKEKLRHDAEAASILGQSDQLHRALFNSISHELRTPLSVIQAATDQLTREIKSSSQKELISEINEALDRLKRLVRNLLDSARLESGRLEPRKEWCELGDLVESAIELTAPVLSRKQLQLRLPAEDLLFRADFGLLAQAVANILHNAAVHTPPSSSITLSAEALPDTLILRIADTGQGIPPSLLPRLFDKFQRADDARPGGTGLGLSIARGFVEAQRGTLEAFNAPEGGAVFLIRLPLEKSSDLAELKS